MARRRAYLVVMTQNEPSRSEYAIVRTVASGTFDETIARTQKELAAEGLGVLSDIDVNATLAKKLGVEVPRYRILGACNPQLAHRVLDAEWAIGVLLPCNVVVAEKPDGRVVVAAVDPMQMFSVVDREDLSPVADEVRERLTRVVDRVAS
jgi:uncharacterized protein (DUF302 family)